MDHLKPPPPICFDQNLNKNYEKFKQRFEIFLTACDLQDKSDGRKIALFLNAAGEEAIEVYNTLKITEENKKVYDSVVAAFDEYCKPRNNETYNRYKFFSRSRAEGETMDHFIKDLKILAKQCNFGEQEESLIRDRIILGITDMQLQERLLSKDGLTLNIAETMCKATEATKIQAKEIKGEEVNLIGKMNSDKHRGAGQVEV